MKTKIERIVLELMNLEEKIIKGNVIFKSDWDHWNIIDTIYHTNTWKLYALDKVKQRVNGNMVFFKNERSVDEINLEIYRLTDHSNYNRISDLQASIKRVLKEVFHKIKGAENDNKYCPIGFVGNVNDYLLKDLLIHPVQHYLYFGMRNNDISIHTTLAAFIRKNKNQIMKDESIFKLDEFINENTNYILDRSGIWYKNDLYKKIQEMNMVNL